jgi:eukaryotic-like serine/threonine-protein kinase
VTVPQRPKRLGAYDVLAKIAAGGMATIYLGREHDPNGLQHVAAIKVIKQELAEQEEFVHMFMDEAKILSLLDHPNVSSALAHGVTDNQRFIVMDLLLGRTVLDTWRVAADRGISFDLDMAAWIGGRVAHGLHHAHELRDETGQPIHLIHRDVTPSNIFLTYGGEVKLFDFGLAKAKGRRHATKSGVVKGKVSYFSPEQIEMLPLDRRSDVYTLGVTLWELTTMTRLFHRDTDLEAVFAIRSGLVPDARQIVDGYPDELWNIVAKALRQDRDGRYATAEELAHDLDRFVEACGATGPKRMPERIGDVLDDLFPGERERQAGWLRQTAAQGRSVSGATMPPPAPMLPMPNEAPESLRPPSLPRPPLRR